MNQPDRNLIRTSTVRNGQTRYSSNTKNKPNKQQLSSGIVSSEIFFTNKNEIARTVYAIDYKSYADLKNIQTNLNTAMQHLDLEYKVIVTVSSIANGIRKNDQCPNVNRQDARNALKITLIQKTPT